MKSLIEINVNNSFNRGATPGNDKVSTLNPGNQSIRTEIISTVTEGSITAGSVSNGSMLSNSLTSQSHSWMRDIVIAVVSIVISAFATHFLGL